MDSALNNLLQWLICHKTKPNQTKPKLYSMILAFAFNYDCMLFDKLGT